MSDMKDIESCSDDSEEDVAETVDENEHLSVRLEDILASQYLEDSTPGTSMQDSFLKSASVDNVDSTIIIKKRENKREKAHKNRARGDAYIVPKTGKMVPARKVLKPRCNGITCTRMKKQCPSFSEEEREQILTAYYGTESLQLQREFVARFVKVQVVKHSTVQRECKDSRRSLSHYYFLPKDGEPIPVCKTMFLNTLNVSEKSLRTALKKKRSTGDIEEDKRGGRRENLKALDAQRTSAILEHISKFSRMDTPHLNKKKMHQMFLDEYKERGISASYATYINILKSQNMSSHHPKTDECKVVENEIVKNENE